MPKVSVCIPAYNAAQYLPRAIESVLSQEFEDYELVVSDDASNDGTAAVCGIYDDTRFRYAPSAARLGQAGNWNRCIDLARGDYVILLHADDELHPAYLSRTVAVLDDHADVTLVHCAPQHIDETGNRLSVEQLFEEDRIDREEAILRHLLLDGCVINPAGVIVRRNAYDAVGRFTDRIVWGVDWHMWIRIALRFPLAYLAEPLAMYRQHGQSGTSAVMTSGRNAQDELWAALDLFELVDRTRPDLSHLRPAVIHGVAHRTWCFAETMCQQGERTAARIGIRNALRIWPGMARDPKVWALWAATYTGYQWFAKAHRQKRRFGGKSDLTSSAAPR